MAIWSLWDYVELSGRNRVSEWLHTLPDDAQAAIAARLLKMESLDKWSDKWASSLSGYDKIVELRIGFNKVQYRPLGMYLSDHRFVILCGAIEKGGELPVREIKKAVKRRKDVLGEAKHVRPHQY